MKQRNIELIRLPIGYWDSEPDDPYPSTLTYIDWAMDQAAHHNISVLLDLHGAPGSQNGYNHSGRQGKASWWHDRTHRLRTLRVLRDMATRYGASPALWGIELLNEPRMPWYRYFLLIRFYRTAYREIRTRIRPGVWTIFHDAFHPILLAGSLHTRKNHPIAMDIHWYGFPSRHVRRFSLATYLRLQAIYLRTLIWWVQRWQPVIIGEWSAVAPQDYMERRPKRDYPHIWRENGNHQQEIFRRSNTIATCYWTYKGQGRGVWHGRSLDEDDILTL